MSEYDYLSKAEPERPYTMAFDRDEASSIWEAVRTYRGTLARAGKAKGASDEEIAAAPMMREIEALCVRFEALMKRIDRTEVEAEFEAERRKGVGE